MPTKYLTEARIIAINQNVIKQSNSKLSAIQDNNGLNTILKQMKMQAFGRELYPDMEMKAAYLVQKLTKKHIFADGNKRTALIAMITFLKLNQYDFKMSDNDLIKFILDATTKPDNQDSMFDLMEQIEAHSINTRFGKHM